MSFLFRSGKKKERPAEPRGMTREEVDAIVADKVEGLGQTMEKIREQNQAEPAPVYDEPEYDVPSIEVGSPFPQGPGTYEPDPIVKPQPTPEDAPRPHPSIELRDGFPYPPIDPEYGVDPRKGELYTAPTPLLRAGVVNAYVFARLLDGEPAAGMSFQFCDANWLPYVHGAYGCPGVIIPGSLDREHLYVFNRFVAQGGERVEGWHRPALPNESTGYSMDKRVALLFEPYEDYDPYTSYATLDENGEYFCKIRISRQIRDIRVPLRVKVNGRELHGPGEYDLLVFVSEVEDRRYIDHVTEENFPGLARGSADRD